MADEPQKQVVEEDAKSETAEASKQSLPSDEGSAVEPAQPTPSEHAGDASDASQSDEQTPEVKTEEPTHPFEGGKKASKPVSKDLEKIIEQIEKLSVLELADLVHALEERFGVSASAPMTVAQAGAAPVASGEPQEEKTTFNVILTPAGANKIAVIKAVRELVQTLGLKEAKDLVEGAPKPVLESVNKATAEEAKAKLTATGATVELQ